MQELLAHPAIQGGIAPFIVASGILLLFRRMGNISFGFAIIGGFLTAVMLTTGLSLQPLTSTRKIILVSLCLPFLLLLMEMLLRQLSINNTRWLTTISAVLPSILLVMAIIWVIWPVLTRQETSEAWLLAVKMGLYAGVISAIFLGIARSKRPEKTIVQGVSTIMLALGTAITSMIAASALYAQLAFSIAASVIAVMGGLMLVSLLKMSLAGVKDSVAGLGTFGLFAAAVPVALIGAAATVYAQLPEWVLFCLVAVPLFACWPMRRVAQPWMRVTFTSLLAFLPVIPAIWLAWRAAGAVSY